MINFCRRKRAKNDVHHVHDILHSLQEIYAMCPLLVNNAVHQWSLRQNPRICSMTRSKECAQSLALQFQSKMFTVWTWVHVESSHELSLRNCLYVFLHSTTSVREGSAQGKEGMNQRFLERKLTMWTPTMTAATVTTRTRSSNLHNVLPCWCNAAHTNNHWSWCCAVRCRSGAATLYANQVFDATTE